MDLIFGAKKKTQIGVVQFDACLSETHTSEVEITDLPVETGVDVTDHIKLKPNQIQITGEVTNTPIVLLPSIFGKSPITTDKKPITDRVNAAYTKLKELQKAGEELDIVTSLETYSNHVIQSLVFTRDVSSGNILNCSATLRQIQKSITQEADMPELIKDKKPEDKGKKEKKPAEPKQKEDISTLKSAKNLVVK
jgi:hypothetical protein